MAEEAEVGGAAVVAVPKHAGNETESDEEDNTSKPMEMESGDLRKFTSSVRDMEDTRTKGFVILVAIAAALGGLIFGFDIGGAGATFVMQGFREHFEWGKIKELSKKKTKFYFVRLC